MNKKISLGAAIAIMLVVAAATFSMTMIYARTTFDTTVNNLKKREQMFEKFTEINQQVQQNYNGDIDETVLMDSVARGYIGGIGDKYAMYISAEEYRKLTRGSVGDNVGIGAVIEVAPDNYLVVKEVYPESPAQAAGIEAGDLIVKVDDTDLTKENSEQQLAAIQGPQGAKITLVVRKGNEDVTVELTRRSVAVPTVYSRIIADTEVGYIWIKEFGDNTSHQFNRELQKLLDAGVKSLIFDVRDNKGGTMLAVNRILDKLCPEGILGTAYYKDGSTVVLATSDASEISLPMTVLINAGTASAAELFAQDLKDFQKGTTVGATTMGKGVMQNIIKLSDGSAIDLTVALFTSTDGNNFNEVGIKPDFDVMLEGDWRGLDEMTDPQLKKAVEVAIATQKTAEPTPEASEESPASSESSQASQPATPSAEMTP